MTRRPVSTMHVGAPVQFTIGLRWASLRETSAVQTATRVIGDVAIIVVTLALALLIAVTLFGPMLA